MTSYDEQSLRLEARCWNDRLRLRHLRCFVEEDDRTTKQRRITLAAVHQIEVARRDGESDHPRLLELLLPLELLLHLEITQRALEVDAIGGTQGSLVGG